MADAHSYLHFNGNCEEAFNLYRTVFGGDFSLISRYGDMPTDPPVPLEEEKKIMHISLPLQKGSVLLGSDIPAGFPKGVRGNSYYISINTESAEEARKVYAGLTDGGQIFMPLEKTFWASLFGMFSDQYGVQWMVSYNEPQQ
ncbi:MAG: VOC family protein [Bacteroidota bacterium]|nr:VOC family protein [Bacteroidota bacterium]